MHPCTQLRRTVPLWQQWIPRHHSRALLFPAGRLTCWLAEERVARCMQSLGAQGALGSSASPSTAAATAAPSSEAAAAGGAQATQAVQPDVTSVATVLQQAGANALRPMSAVVVGRMMSARGSSRPRTGAAALRGGAAAGEELSEKPGGCAKGLPVPACGDKGLIRCGGAAGLTISASAVGRVVALQQTATHCAGMSAPRV